MLVYLYGYLFVFVLSVCVVFWILTYFNEILFKVCLGMIWMIRGALSEERYLNLYLEFKLLYKKT